MEAPKSRILGILELIVKEVKAKLRILAEEDV